MKLTSVLIGVLFLITIIQGAKSSAKQQHLAQKNHNLGQILRESSLGNGLISMVQLFSKNMNKKEDVNPDSTQNEWEDLFVAIDLLQTSLQEKLDAENEDFLGDGDVHSEELQRINALLSGYLGTEATLEVTEDNLQNQFNLLSLEIKNLEGQLAAAEKGRDSENQYLSDAQEKYAIENADYTEAITLLEEAVAKLEEAQDQSESAGFTQFLQTNQMNFETFAVMLQKSVVKMADSKLVFMTPITAIFTDLQGKSRVEPARIAGAVNALKDLVVHLQKGQMKLAQLYNADQTSHSALLAQYIVVAGQLFDISIPATQANIDINVEATEINDASLSEVRGNIREETQNIDDENDSWDQRQEIHTLLTTQLVKEQGIVSSASELLQANRPAQPQTNSVTNVD